MADSFTSRLRLILQEVGAKIDIWGDSGSLDLNKGIINLVDDAIAEVYNVDLSLGDNTLTTNNGADDTARNLFLRSFGIAVVDIDVIAPTLQHLFIIRNDGTIGLPTILKTLAGTGVSVKTQKNALCYVDEVLDEVFEAEMARVAAVLPSAWLTGTADIVDRTAGTTTVTYRYMFQGAHRALMIPTFSSTCSGTVLELVANTPAAFPEEIYDPNPLTSGALGGSPNQLVYCDDDGTTVPCQFQIGQNQTDNWRFDRLDGVAPSHNNFTAATARGPELAVHQVWMAGV